MLSYSHVSGAYREASIAFWSWAAGLLILGVLDDHVAASGFLAGLDLAIRSGALQDAVL